MKKILIFSIILLFGLLSCNKKNHISKNKQGATDANIPHVKVIKPNYRSFNSEFHIIGNALPDKQIKIHSMESGYVLHVHNDIGDMVTKDQVLAILQNPDIERDLEISNVQMENQKKHFLRIKNVYTQSPELTTAQEYENAEANYLTAKSTYESNLKRNNLLKIKAPFDGIITKRFIDEGAVVQSSLSHAKTSALFEIVNTNIVRLNINVPENHVDNISIGMPAQVSFSDMPEKKFEATISRMASVVDNQSKTMSIELDIENENHQIKAGMYAEVNMILESSSNKLSLPVSTLYSKNNEFWIWKVKADNTVEKIPIQKGFSNNDFFEIISPRVNKDDFIIVEGKNLVSNGNIVKTSLY